MDAQKPRVFTIKYQPDYIPKPGSEGERLEAIMAICEKAALSDKENDVGLFDSLIEAKVHAFRKIVNMDVFNKEHNWDILPSAIPVEVPIE